MAESSIPIELRGDPIYPLPADDYAYMLTGTLVMRVARTLREHGYPPISNGGDLASLRDALAGFLHGGDETAEAAR